MTGDNSAQTSRSQMTAASAATAPIAAPRLITLILLSALSVLPVNMTLPSLPNIAATFHADPALINLSVAGFAIFTALTELVAGAMSDRYGRRAVALAAISIFVLASLGCAASTDIGTFLLFRMLQAAIGACFSISLVIARETSGERQAASKFGYLAVGWAIAPLLGPTFGGLLDELFGWRACFLALALLGAAALALCSRELKGPATHASEPRRNYLTSYRQLLGSARFWAYTLCMICSMGTFYVFLGGAPLAVGNSLNGSSTQLGLYMGMVPAGFILGSYLTGRYASRFQRGTVVVVARSLTCIGLLVGLALSMSGVTHILAFFGPCMFIGIGNGLTMPAANTGVMSVRANLSGTAVGLAAAMRIAGGALVSSIGGLFLAEQHAVLVLFGIMLTTASLALSAALVAAIIDRRISE
ncbi:MFS transporter [Rhizobium sp. BK376]|uniref:MFS transporter n=1 Tax=Rhizobium sp. BK376 TaxID=2512149 RepID=UPI0010457E60|nr:MFS transporter [Rhizobium sp. BK376]TCR75686.1 putative MFS family arabinose efflux permease [Rhizobium sp. BK376]